MEFREFKEFDNPEERDYDITSSLREDIVNNEVTTNDYLMELIEMIGILEDGEIEHIEELYGITEKEYDSPTRETIEKVRAKLEQDSTRSI